MKPFDIANATPDEVRAEADRRWAERNGAKPTVVLQRTPRIEVPRRVATPDAAPLLVLPFGLLVRDNEKYGVMRGRILLKRTYRANKERCKVVVRRQLPDDWEPFAVPVTFTATLYEPDRSRKRDIVNYAKMVQDVCSRLVYADDHLIDRATWVRGPVDETTPRLEIAVTTLDKSLPRWNT